MKTYESYVHKLKSITSAGTIDVKKLNDINRGTFWINYRNKG